jgi:PPP family 3-phenylpropionic acid transporter
MFTLKNDTTAVRAKPPTLHDSLRLCARPEVLLFMLSGMIHWGTISTYNSFFVVHMTNLKAPAYYIGLGMSAGVFTEILVMWHFRRIRQAIPLLPLLLIGEFSTVLRWLAIGQLENQVAVAALQVMHGLTFGIYFPACIDYLERVATPEMRATGRAVFASIAMGMGGVLGNLLAGNMYDAGGKGIAGGQLAFTVAGAVELAAPLLMLGAWYFIPRQLPPPPKPSAGEAT